MTTVVYSSGARLYNDHNFSTFDPADIYKPTRKLVSAAGTRTRTRTRPVVAMMMMMMMTAMIITMVMTMMMMMMSLPETEAVLFSGV